MLLAPNLFSDDNGDYTGFDWKVRSLTSTTQTRSTPISPTGTSTATPSSCNRCSSPRRVGDMMQSLVNDAEQSGWLPRWAAANDVTYVMNGDSPAILLSSAYAFGARNFDTKTALQYMVKAATQPGKGPHDNEERPYLTDYLKLGYVPIEKDGSAASRTLEYASDDFAIAQLARSLGDTTDYEKLLKQSENWKNLFDPETRWIRPRRTPRRMAPGLRRLKVLCPSAPTRPSPLTRTASKRATPTSTPS